MMHVPDLPNFVPAAVLGLLALAAALWFVNRRASPLLPVGALSLDQTIRDIKAELMRLEADPGPRLGLTLSAVKIELQLRETERQTGTAGLAVPVFKAAEVTAGRGLSQDQGSKVTIVLAPPPDRMTLSADGPAPALRFADLLIAARTSLAAAMDSEPRLDARSIEVKVDFVLVSDASAGAEVTVKVVSIGTETTRSLSTGNAVTLSYASPAHAGTEAPAP
jgi:hypothetical protein